MIRFLNLVVVACVVGQLVGCGGAGIGGAPFQEFTSQEGKFKVLMPDNPKKQNQSAAGVNVTMYTHEERSGGYTVSYADMPIPAGESPQQTEIRLTGARDGMVNNIKAKFTGDSKITLNGKYPGREVNADLPNNKGLLKARIYIVNQRLYQLLVIGYPSWVNSSDATKFLDSFALME